MSRGVYVVEVVATKRFLNLAVNVISRLVFLEGGGEGDFSIQGATDGNSNFRIQGATDGHSNFQIQGASDGGAATFNIQGATDGHSQSTIQGPYDANQGNAKALEYNDPSGTHLTSSFIALPPAR